MRWRWNATLTEINFLVGDCFLVQRFETFVSMSCRWTIQGSWTVFKIATFGLLHVLRPRLSTAIVVDSKPDILMLLRAEKKVWDRGFCLASCSDELLAGIQHQMGPLHCFCGIVGRFGNLQPWGISYCMRAWLALERHWIKPLFNWFPLTMSRWHSQSLDSSTEKSYKYSMWMYYTHGCVVPRLMSFPKVWIQHVSFISPFLARRLALLMVLMTSQAPQTQTSVGLLYNAGARLWRHLDVIQPHVHIVYPANEFFFTQHSTCPRSSAWLCSSLTETTLTPCEIHSLGPWAGLWQRRAVRVHPSESNCLHFGRSWLSQTWAGLFQPLCWISAYKDADFNQTRQGSGVLFYSQTQLLVCTRF